MHLLTELCLIHACCPGLLFCNIEEKKSRIGERKDIVVTETHFTFTHVIDTSRISDGGGLGPWHSTSVAIRIFNSTWTHLEQHILRLFSFMSWNALIRTHHITSRKKVAKLKQAADAIQVFALLRSGGSPGIMYVEGDEKGVKQWVDSVHVCNSIS